MVLGVGDIDFNVDGFINDFETAAANGFREAQSVFATFISKVANFIRFALERIWEMMKKAYDKAIDFLYDYVGLLKNNPKAFTLLTADLIILFGE